MTLRTLILSIVLVSRLVEQVLEPAPRRLELLELRVVHDLVELERDQVVDLRDARVDHRLGVAGDRDRSLRAPRTTNSLDHVLAALLRGRVASRTALASTIWSSRPSFGSTAARRLPAVAVCGLSHCCLPRGPISDFSFFILSASSSVACRISSSLSLPCRLPRRSASLVRSSSISLSGLTCRATVSGEKSSRLSKLRSTAELAGVRVVAELVLHRELQVRLHALQHVVEVVGVDLDELAVLELGERLGGLPVKSPSTPITNGSSFISIAPPVSTS